MTVTPELLVAQTVAALAAARTDAGDRVYSPGDWPTEVAEFPLLLVQAIRDHKASQGRGQPSFTVVTTIRITGRVSSMGAAADQGGRHAEAKLYRLSRQAECGVINADAYLDPDTGLHYVQQFPTIDTQFGVSATGVQIAEFVMDVGFEYFQSTFDFYPTPEAEIDQIVLEDRRPALGLNPT